MTHRDPASGLILNRRALIAGLGASAAAFSCCGALARPARGYKATAPGGSIDVHHHYSPPEYRGRLRWSPKVAIEQMDKFGIAISVISMVQQKEILYDGTEKGRAAVRRVNDLGARAMADHPGRFGLFATLPFPDVEGSLREIEYIFDVLKADGISIHTNDHQGHWPGDPRFEPMWQELNRRSAIVYVHPQAPTCCDKLQYGPSASMLEFDFDITRAVASIVTNGVMFRYPKLRFITPHSGGAVPMLAGRMKDRYPKDPERLKYIPDGLYAELRKWYYDIGHASFPMPMAAMRAIMPDSQILFGTDFFPEPIESTVDELPALRLPRKTLIAIERGNAERLFPRFKLRA